MKTVNIIFALLLIQLIGCKTPTGMNAALPIKATPNAPETDKIAQRQDSLAFVLCQIYGLDQYVRPDMKENERINWNVIEHVDSISYKKVLAFVKDNGFPTNQLLGEKNFSHECVAMSAVTVLLHNPHRLVKEEENLNLLIAEVKKGNLKAETLATILDKYYWSKRGNNHHVLYGSQFGMPCLSIKEQANAARERIGLKPLADSLFVKCD